MSNFIYAKGVGDFDPSWSDEEDGPLDVEYWASAIQMGLFQVVDMGVLTEAQEAEAENLTLEENWPAFLSWVDKIDKSDLSNDELQKVRNLRNAVEVLIPERKLRRHH